MRLPLVPSSIHKLCCDGIHMSFIVHPENEKHHLATICKKVFFVGYEEPRIEHEVYLMHLDEFYNINHCERIELPKTEICSEIGAMNVVLVNPNRFVGYLVGHNGEGSSEFCLCDFSDNKVTKVRRLDALGSQNPVVLKAMNHNLFAIHSYDPLKVLSLNMDEGTNQMVHMQKIFETDGCVVVGGAAAYSERYKKYIILLRVEQQQKYTFSCWLLLTERYKLCGLSEPFKFNESDSSYECCVSLLVRHNVVCASVAINHEMYVYEYAIENVIKNTAWN